MGAQTFQPVGGTAGGEIPEMGSEIGSAKATDVPLPAGEGDQETIVFAEEQIETPIGAVVLSCRFGHFVDSLQTCIGVIDAGHEAEIAFVGSLHQLSQIGEAVDVFAEGCEFELLAPIALFHPTVVFEEGDIVGGAFHPCHETEFIVELEAPHRFREVLLSQALGPSFGETRWAELRRFLPVARLDVFAATAPTANEVR